MCLPIDSVRVRDITANVAAHIADGTNYIQVHPTFLYEIDTNDGRVLPENELDSYKKRML